VRVAVTIRAALLVVVSMLLAAACDSTADPGVDGPFLSEGDQAPGFTLPSAGGEQVALADFTNHKPVLLYFSMGPG
jgi:cytochrome oxidase Cu insertion factor (SCO1/SenC/PrrC family)